MRGARAVPLLAIAALVGTPASSLATAPSGAAGCHDWSTFGADERHSFSTPSGCSSITKGTVDQLVPAWFTPMKDSVTASPTVFGDTAFVGSWDGTFDALDVVTGAVRWTFLTSAHAPSAFGRIVSSASVTQWPVPGRAAPVTAVIFGGGSSVWVLDAATGHELAVLDVDPRTPELRAQQEAGDSPPVVEVESSPVVTEIAGQRRILVGLDVHNDGGVGRTGLVSLALTPHADRAWDLRPVWKYDVETAHTYVGAGLLTVGSGQGRGCGGVWSSPAVAQGIVVFGTASCGNAAAEYDAGENYAESMVALDAATGRLRWRYRPADDLVGRDARVADAERDADFGASPNIFAIGPKLVVGEGRKSGDYVVRDLVTGSPVTTTAAGPEGFVQSGFGIGGFLGTTAVDVDAAGSPRVVGATAIPVPHSAGDVDRTTWAVRAVDPVSGTVMWTYRLAGPSYAHTSVVDHVALVPDTTTCSLVALDALSGTPLWVAPVVGPPSSTAVVAGSTVLVGTGTRETDLEYKAVNRQLQDALTGSVGASPLSPVSGVQAFRLPVG